MTREEKINQCLCWLDARMCEISPLEQSYIEIALRDLAEFIDEEYSTEVPNGDNDNTCEFCGKTSASVFGTCDPINQNLVVTCDSCYKKRGTDNEK